MPEKPTFTSHDKLVRDKIPEIIKTSNRTPECKILDGDREYLRYLVKKLHEEVAEFTEDPCVEELADVKEVIDTLSRIRGFEDVLRVQEKKREERGGFEKRILLTGVYEEREE
ncbi:phosphoribosyl-ATP pyrophosphohydrolase [Methanosarcina sp. KYL-1]|uniref:nucleoside triphosphate pyrophosphohydrolase n=1 Tax=Methanosarcina sp. KYL-1 TaxID=2602068 RepID=UPI0021011128|nr:nucleoside triphosphate pyrophosphohydrolase [Methanosarcina sp. KYL-1]MCQ1535564.1 phosphoribosyl-ATP pyrophosphohydrolase [Methanosarcina sp. KYL-1]